MSRDRTPDARLSVLARSPVVRAAILVRCNNNSSLTEWSFYLIKLPSPKIIAINMPEPTAAFLLAAPNPPVCIKLETATAEEPARNPVPIVSPVILSLLFNIGSMLEK